MIGTKSSLNWVLSLSGSTEVEGVTSVLLLASEANLDDERRKEED